MLDEPRLNYPPDRGCRYHPACLSCPEPACLFETGRRPSAKQPGWQKMNPHRARVIARMVEVQRRYAAGKTVARIALELGVCRRTVGIDLRRLAAGYLSKEVR